MKGKEKSLRLGQFLVGSLYHVFDFPFLWNTPSKRPIAPADR